MNSEYYSGNQNTEGISILIEPIDVTAREGSYVNLSAAIKAQKPSYQWYNKEGKPIKDKCENNLFIGPISKTDFGFYRLSIFDEVTNQRLLTRWVEIKNSKQEINHSQKQNIKSYTYNRTAPKLIVEAKGGVYIKGETINLTAHFENAMYYQWYKDGIMLESCIGNTLLITDAVIANTGTYILLASNEHNLTNQMQVRVVIN